MGGSSYSEAWLLAGCASYAVGLVVKLAVRPRKRVAERKCGAQGQSNFEHHGYGSNQLEVSQTLCKGKREQTAEEKTAARLYKLKRLSNNTGSEPVRFQHRVGGTALNLITTVLRPFRW